MNAPLMLTCLRIAAIPLLVIVLLSNFRGKELVSFAIFFIATLTDMLDGFWARRKRQTTVLGQLLDPTADKLLIASALICLVEMGTVPAWMAVIIIGREMAVSGFRAMASSKGITIPASLLGKIKMILETFTIYLLLLGEKILGPIFILSRVGLWLVILVAVVSAAEYSLKFGRAVVSGRT
ncbi:MAG: CDP-diacylglycerol--glycerol-3-phosphate 3-phosphatidyltransferase [Clostridiales bacterium]|nr:CDP-diacylglycerol--glycerol-3-phosphate 3-phosphatidyltransferase [Clostridiales bacterium]